VIRPRSYAVSDAGRAGSVPAWALLHKHLPTGPRRLGSIHHFRGRNRSPISLAHRDLPASSEPSCSATLLGLPEYRGTPHSRFDEATAALKVISDVMASRSTTLRLPDRIAWRLQILPRADTSSVFEAVQQAVVGHIRMCRADPAFQQSLRRLLDAQREVFERLTQL